MNTLHQLETGIEGLQAQIICADPTTRISLPEQRTLSELRAHRNDIASPLLSCPPEILFHILHITVWTNHLTYPLCDTYILQNLLRVCVRMRALVLASPGLWSYIILDRGPKWTTHCIERAGAVPLSIAWTCWGATKDNVFWDAVGKCPSGITPAVQVESAWKVLEKVVGLRRVHNLLVCGGIKSQAMGEILNSASLPLHTLAYQPRVHNHVRISPTFLGGETASLRELKLSSVQLLAHDLSFPSLVALDLRLCDIHTESDPARLFRLLRRAPRLERLGLSDISPDDHVCAESEPIDLPALKVVCFEGSLPWALALMRVLPMPSQAYSIKVEPSYSDREPAMRAWRAEAYAEMSRIMAVDWDTAVVHLRARRRPEVTHACLELTLMDERMRPFTFRDRCTATSALLPVLHRARVAHFLGWAADRVASLAASDPARILPMLEHIIVDGAPDFFSLLPWLRARAAAGRRMHTLDVRALYDADASLRSIIDEGLAEVIIVCGRTLDLAVDARATDPVPSDSAAAAAAAADGAPRPEQTGSISERSHRMSGK
jgi:hypothetical protein